MFKVLVMIELFGGILCRVSTDASYVENNLELEKSYLIVPRTVPEYRKAPTGLQRSYYSGYGTAVSPTYYPAIDPLSVLASLAFLAFLIQSFASMFDRSRSIAPTTVTARHFMELKMLALSTQVLRALEKYEENHNGRLIANTKRKVTA
ncbi:uncharacterized protein LOC143376997 [Andrena cerasifolii]|uniref:uncharacterized protein LOC143376997 n=1 Tax=Andrena cerasifolii TaxID=2819439 RepID=UPI004037DCFC